jgi:CRP-like cAMP-binding protein
VLSIAGAGQALGLDEILLDKPHREHTLRVISEKAVIYFMSKQDFVERVLESFPDVKRDLMDQLLIRRQYLEQREQSLGKFHAQQTFETLKVIYDANISTKPTISMPRTTPHYKSLVRKTQSNEHLFKLQK